MRDDGPTLRDRPTNHSPQGQETEMNKTVDEWVSLEAKVGRIVGEDNLPADQQDLQDYAAELAEKASSEGIPFGVVDIRLCLDREAEITSALLRDLEERG